MTGGHAHGTAAEGHRGRLAIVLGLVCAVLVAQVVGGLLAGSLALLADAGHMATDAFGISMALLAVTVAQRPATSRRTFGWQRMEIMAAAGNALLLFGVACYVLFEAVRRFANPPEVASGLMLAVALGGLAANAVSLWLLRHGQRESLNVRGAYLEVLGDLLSSCSVVVAALVIALTGFHRADVIASALVGLLILPRSWALLREAFDVLMEATPRNVDLDEVRRHMLGLDGVLDVHDLHAWTVTSGLPVLSAHVTVTDEVARDGLGGRVLDELCRCLAGHFDVEHCTFQLEQRGHREHEPSCTRSAVEQGGAGRPAG